MNKIILHGKEAKEKLLKGINLVANTVKITSGPRGNNVIIGSANKHATPIIINDGVTIAKEIYLSDPIENIGASLIKQAAISTNEIAGDGTTTSTILAQGIINSAVQLIDQGYSSVFLKKGIIQGMEKVKEALEEQKIIIDNNKQIIAIAALSSNSLQSGEIIARAFDVVGKNGIIKIEDSQSFKSTLELAKGFEMTGGYLSPYMINNKDKNIIEHKKIKILLFNNVLEDLNPIIDLLEESRKHKIPLLIIASDFSEDVISALAINNLKKIVEIIAVKPKNYFQHLNTLWNDLEAITNTSAIVMQNPTKEDIPSWDDLGTVEKLLMDNEKTTFIYNNKTDENFQNYINELNNQLLNIESFLPEYEILKTRIAKLTNSAAIIKIAGITELDQKEKKYRMEDALNATKFAINEGIIPGGGLAYINCMKKLKDFSFDDKEINAGWQLVFNSLSLPLKQIALNSGSDPDQIFDSIWSCENLNIGFDALKLKMIDVYEIGLIDPFKVSITALEKACSVAASVITTEAVIAYPNSKNHLLDNLSNN